MRTMARGPYRETGTAEVFRRSFSLGPVPLARPLYVGDMPLQASVQLTAGL